jgi:hypothetical protein
VIRQIPTGLNGGAAGVQLTLGEGTAAWLSNEVTHAVDLTSAGSAPVTLAGRTRSMVLDDHRVARQLYPANRALPAPVRIEQLPFTARHRPRLIGTVALLGFTPNGDGKGDVWAPKFDVTKPLTKVSLRITASTTGRVVRTLTTTAPDGSLRGLSWDGRSDRGTKAAPGIYHWRLSGVAGDGDGSLIGANGGAVSGSIEIDAV